MSRTNGNTEKTASTRQHVARPDTLHWDVFVTPGIPIVSRDKPPGVQETFFQATASTLIYGVRDAVLVDAFMTVKQASALADWVAARGKNLTTIYITHGHGDHWFGVGTLLERFPNAKTVTMPNAVKPECLARSSRRGLEGGISRTNPGQAGDRGRAQGQCH
jgi:glyoxylase-like metal-dependent hydrolase (beta-lactamase superfamily II)